MKLKELMKQKMPISNGIFLLIVLVFSVASAICAGITAAMVVYDNSKSGVIATTVQDAIDEILMADINKKGNLNIEGKINGANIFIKTGNNEGITCEKFCREELEEKSGNCVAGRLITGEYVGCDIEWPNSDKILDCVCIGF